MANFVRLSRLLKPIEEKTEEITPLDDRDRKILCALSENSRISFRVLGQIANLSSNATAERVHRLQKLGVIRGYSVDISPGQIGLHLEAFVDIKLQQGKSLEMFERALRKIDGVREAVSLTGAFDARLRVDCKDTADLGRLIEQLRSQAGITETSSTVICRELNIKNL